jgi:aminopeptidase N
MKKYFYITVFLLFCLNVAGKDGYTRNLSADVLHYEFSISVSDTSNIIFGHAEITVKFTQAAKSFSLDLKNAGNDGKGMHVKVVRYDKGSITWNHSGDRITINMEVPSATGTQGVFEIEYSGIPADGLIISDNKYGDRTFFADNWPDRAHNWLPCVDHPYDKATVDFIVTAPDHYEVVGSGYLVEESCMPSHNKLTHWREDVPLATKVMAVGIAPFATHFEGNIDNIPVWSWVYSENRKEGFSDYAAAVRPLAFYSELIGPYPYEKLANVQSKTIFGGLENAGTIFYAENSVTGQGKAESLMAHEIAHQWFGNSVTENDWHHIWLSEGFATYLTAVFQEKTYGKQKFDEQMKLARDRVLRYSMRSSSPVVDTTITDLMKLLSVNSYQKGAWVLHMLRRELGEEVFWKGMRLYYSKFRDSNALTSDFEKVMETVSNRRLDGFFSQWIFTGGEPDLKITFSQSSTAGYNDIIIEQKQEHLFTFNIEIQVKGSSGSQNVIIPVSDRITKKSVKSDRIIEIIADPETDLLFKNLLD